MRKLIFTLLAVLTLNFHGWTALPLSTPSSLQKIETADNPVFSKEKQFRIAQMKLFASLTPEKYGELRGKKLNIFERFSFKTSQ
jgi:hypothetical protein